MKNNEYFIEALQAQAYKKLDWVIDCFSVTEYPQYEDQDFEQLYPYQLVHSKGDKTKLYFVDSIEQSISPLEDYKPGTPLMRFDDRIILKPNDLPNVSEEIDTRYGNVFVNAYIYCYAFGDKIPFATGKINHKKIEKEIANRLQPYNPNVDPTTRDRQYIYVDELLKHNDAASSLEGIMMLAVPSMTLPAMMPSQGVIDMRDKLLKEHKDELHNPAIIAAIMAKLSAYEKEQLKGTDAEGFYIKDSAYSVTRMKRFIMYGIEGGFGETTPKFIPRSLKEGWDVTEFPALVDGLRGGSYARGSETAVGGEWVKHFQRVFQNIQVVEDDCKTKHGMQWTITDYNYTRFVGLNRIQNGQSKLLDLEECQALIGKTIIVRTPMLCKTQAPNFCAACCGVSIAASANALHSITSQIGSVFMLARMKSMHGKATQTRPYDYKTAIS